MKRGSSPAVIAELKRIAALNGGLLLPENIVKAARPESSPLHDKFEWDNTAAAQQWRLWQARQLISVTVEFYGPIGNETAARVYVSLTPDRFHGGYRSIVDVMNNKTHRDQLLADAIDEMQRFQEKYANLKELVAVFAAMRLVTRRNHDHKKMAVPAKRSNGRASSYAH